MKRKPVKMGRKVGYLEYCRIWDQTSNKVHISASDLCEPGNFVSPHGVAWRPCGLHYPGLLLIDWKSGRRHAVDFATIMRAARLGWVWRPDSMGEAPKCSISRWPDGTHYYVRQPNGDPVVFKGREKFNSYGEAHRAAVWWAVRNGPDKQNDA